MGFYHRDLKIENVFLDYSEEENKISVKVGDFGLASIENSDGNLEPYGENYGPPEFVRKG